MSTLPVLTFGALLRRARLAAGLSQEELAERARLSREAISTLERGTRRAPRQETIDLLADALSLAPAERARLHQVARGQAPPPIAAVSHPRLPVAREVLFPLIGRQPEVARLARHLAGEGSPLLLFAGEPGIGKSRLLQEAVQRARAQGWTVLEGGCHRRSGQEPFAPLLGALEGRLRYQPAAQQRQELPGCAWLVRLLPELAEAMPTPAASWSLPPEQERRLMFAAVARYLANVAGPAGTLLVLDDLQWAGADALDLLVHLLRTPGEQPLRVVAAYRSTEVRPPDPLGALLADLGAAGLAEEMRLLPLAPTEASTLLQNVLEAEQGTDSTLRAQVIERTGGVPYFLVSCAQALRLSQQEGGPAPQVPWNVAQSIRQRVVALPDAAQDLLGAAAVVGREAPGTLLLAITAHPQEEAIAALESVDRARLLVESDEAHYQFPHDLIREVVLADLSALRQRQWHKQVAEALEQGPGGAPVEQVAYHYARAGIDEKAVIYLERAGDLALALHAHAEAEGYYRQLLLHLGRMKRSLDAARACEKLGQVLERMAHYDQELEALQQAEAVYRQLRDSERERQVLAKMGRLHARRGTISEGLALLLPVLEAAGPSDPPHGLVALFSAAAYLYERDTRYVQEQLTMAERALKLAQGTADDALLLQAQSDYGWALFYQERYEEALQIEEQQISLAERIGDFFRLADALYCATLLCTHRGEFAASKRYHDRALEAAEQAGYPMQLALLLTTGGMRNIYSGNWQTAHQMCEQAVALAHQASADALSSTPLAIQGRLYLAEGQWQEAERKLEEGLALAKQNGNLNGQFFAQHTLAERALLEGRPQEAKARLEPYINPEEKPNSYECRLLTLLAWAQLELGQLLQAEAALEYVILLLQRLHLYPYLVDALRIQALLCIRQQRWEEAEKALEEAMSLCRTMPYPWAEAKALYVYGLLYQAKDEPAQARDRLAAALAILNRLGERLYAEQVEHTLAEIRQP